MKYVSGAEDHNFGHFIEGELVLSFHCFGKQSMTLVFGQVWLVSRMVNEDKSALQSKMKDLVEGMYCQDTPQSHQLVDMKK